MPWGNARKKQDEFIALAAYWYAGCGDLFPREADGPPGAHTKYAAWEALGFLSRIALSSSQGTRPQRKRS